MKHEHLDDALIQDYCDCADTLPSAALQHLQGCEQCQEAVVAYRELYISLSKAGSPQLSSAFADNVMRTIAAIRPVAAQSRASVPQWLWVGALLAGAGTVSAIVIGQVAVQNIAVQFSELWRHSATSMQNGASEYLSALNLRPATVMMTVLAIGGIVLMDRVLVRVRRARRLFSLMA